MLYQLGRRARVRNPRVPHLSSILAGLRSALMLPPSSINYTQGMAGNLGTMLNNQLGNCTCAAFYHAKQVWSFNATGVMDTQPDSNVLALYEGACGYKPADPSTDQGGVEQDVLSYLLNTGAPIGADGSQRDKIAAFVEVDPTRLGDVRSTIYSCGGAYIGFNVPGHLMANGPPDVWDVSSTGDQSIVGGHAVFLAGYGDDDTFDPISWGRTYKMTPQFFAKYVDEVYAIADTEWLKATGLTPCGVDLADLEAQMVALKGSRVITSDRAKDARLGMLAAYAFDMHAGAALALEPPPDPRLAPGWVLRGYITACDALLVREVALGLGGRVSYGYLAESTAMPGQFVAAIRGTADMIEWAIDAKFAQVDHPAGGHAEAGFYGVFSTMMFRRPGGTDVPVGQGIADAVGQGSVTVIGHSLGAAVATYVALALARDHGLGARVSGRFYESPRPGDQGFADAFAAHVVDAVAYAYVHDEVPEVPAGFGYLPLHCLQLIEVADSQAIIADGWIAAHHIWCIAAMLYWPITETWSVLPIDEPLTACVRGPSHGWKAA